ncbi:Smr/MutS family protein [Hansschlegelia plantiphila]|uniref:DNA mismatch repair protein MutS n=1 Tax=Hansschlegelia plantiphila TaxID=374655 RepID=A0A9W6MW45_9HYPH|nr:Smr/MutS family protein [Hansschlegelia plantiphila]GLK68606.1 DNA mismatch repair protein MutS [Hansschlegelia plantiphila]
MSGGRRRRVVSEAELALWTRVVESVRPLPGRELQPITPSAPFAPETAEPKKPSPQPARTSSQPAPYAPPAPPPLAPLEHRLRRRLARGVVSIDARIDLHGLRQDEAHRRLASFLIGAQASGCKVVLVITGKGRPSAGDEPYGSERGVLRRSVPMWLGSPAARQIIVGFEQADVVHGGAGALYVRIRKGGMRR